MWQTSGMVSRPSTSDGNGPAGRLKEMRERAGYSMEKFALTVGYRGASSYQRFEDPNVFADKFLPIDKVLRFAPALLGKGAPPIRQEEVLRLLPPEQRNIDLQALTRAGPAAEEEPEEPTFRLPDHYTTKMFGPQDKNAQPPHSLPVMGSAQCGESGAFTLNTGDIVGYVDRPPQLEGIRDAYCIYAVENSMEPRYKNGELIYIDPIKPPTQGSCVVIQTRPTAPGEPPRALLKEFVRRDDNRVVLHQYNPDKDIRIDSADIVTIHRVVLAGER